MSLLDSMCVLCPTMAAGNWQKSTCTCFIAAPSYYSHVDPGEQIGNRSPKEKQRQIVPQRNAISLRFCACTKTLSVLLNAKF